MNPYCVSKKKIKKIGEERGEKIKHEEVI